METRTKRRYQKRDEFVNSVRKARCGHISKLGRYFRCESCQPELPSDDDTWLYFADDEASEEL